MGAPCVAPCISQMERVKGIEPSAFSLARRRSTDELRPLIVPWAGIGPASHALQARAMTA